MNNRDLAQIANEIRIAAVDEIYRANSGHPGGSLSAVEIFTCLYFDEMNVDPENPDYEDRDRFVLSKGHTAPALYAALAKKGYFPETVLKTYRKLGTILQGHPDLKKTPGIDMSTGSLGQGVSAAVGLALGAAKLAKDYRIYTLLGDGELQEGQVWEAVMFAAYRKLDNLCLIVDNNGLQLDGALTEILDLGSIAEKFRSFGLHVIHADGHNIQELKDAFRKARETKGQPTVIIARTVKGKGVSFMENAVEWHGAAPNEEQYVKAMEELTKAGDV